MSLWKLFFTFALNFNLMKTTYLFPHRWRPVSGILFLLSSMALASFFLFDWSEALEAKVFAIIGNDGFIGDVHYFSLLENYILDELLVALFIITGIVYAFSKEKQEDELVASLRLHSLAWATITNYTIILFCYLFIYGLPFLQIMMIAMLSQLLIFILLFRYKMYRFYKSETYEE